MSYGPNIDAIYRQLARHAVKLLNGTSAGEIPIEEPTKFELIVNRHTADAIGIQLSPDLLASADRVIEQISICLALFDRAHARSGTC
jgi:putative ABC transport system substrate-binding protein